MDRTSAFRYLGGDPRHAFTSVSTVKSEVHHRYSLLAASQGLWSVAITFCSTSRGFDGRYADLVASATLGALSRELYKKTKHGLRQFQPVKMNLQTDRSVAKRSIVTSCRSQTTSGLAHLIPRTSNFFLWISQVVSSTLVSRWSRHSNSVTNNDQWPTPLSTIQQALRSTPSHLSRSSRGRRYQFTWLIDHSILLLPRKFVFQHVMEG